MDHHRVSDYQSQDPSTLGHSAAKISRKVAKDQGKYSYHQASELLFFVAARRMIDCWQLLLLRIARERDVNVADPEDLETIVASLRQKSKLLTTSEFAKYSLELHQTYTTESAIHDVLKGNHSRVKAPREEGQVVESSQGGDPVLGRSTELMRDAIRQREMTLATADGDVGRVYEQLKFLLFTCAVHPRAASSTTLNIGGVSLPGLPGTRRPVDLQQEYLQRTLSAIVQHKGKDYGERFIREGITRNLGEFQRLKESYLCGVGLERHSQKRSHSSTLAERRTLSRVYTEMKLHVYHPDLDYGRPNITETQSSIGKKWLQDGNMKKMTVKQMNLRGRPLSTSSTPIYAERYIPSDLPEPPLYSTSNVDAEEHSDSESESGSNSIGDTHKPMSSSGPDPKLQRTIDTLNEGGDVDDSGSEDEGEGRTLDPSSRQMTKSNIDFILSYLGTYVFYL
ncbi:hypothetical protein AAF712_010178 [Marasmius tenuissimus]|uniref:DUF6589 domain-containing protein n=1 Tax=Marasmius tenuissimus TaxID=585030 RepID=A0ABR2ZMR6_9AGAR